MEIDFSHDLNEDHHPDGDYGNDDHGEGDENDRHYFENLPLDDDDDDNENYTKKVDEYLQMLQETCETLSHLDGGYRGKLEAYIKKRNQESALYHEVAQMPKGNVYCDLTEVHEMTNEMRWRSTSAVEGPAWKRYLERNPPTKIRGLTAREQAIVNKNMKDRALWGKIMSDPPPSLLP
jgi:hypothetical protein